MMNELSQQGLVEADFLDGHADVENPARRSLGQIATVVRPEPRHSGTMPVLAVLG